MKIKTFVLAVLLGLSASACNLYQPTSGDYYEGGGGNNNKCSANYCYIRSANTCCPNGYLHYAGAGHGCFATSSQALNASGGKDWYETSCIP